MTPQQSAAEKAAVMIGFSEGKPVQWSYKSSTTWHNTDNPHWEFDTCDYRLTPAPTVRPWDRETCPVGSVVKHKESGHRYVIQACNEVDAYLLDTEYPFEALLKTFVTDKGQPCGIVEGGAE